MDRDAVVALEQAATHFRNITYIERRLVVNGVDIAKYLAKAIIAWDDQDYYKFGKRIGKVLRKVFLSKANHAEKLPEGFPDATDFKRLPAPISPKW
jgi:uncharacterized protein with von Willebrand factor type A (vWA) domain